MTSVPRLLLRRRCLRAHRLVNSCTVKNPSQSAFVNIVKRAQRISKPIVVAGCVPQGDRNLNGLEDVSVIGVQQIDRVVEVVEETLKGHAVKLLAKKELPLLDLPKIRKNPLVRVHTRRPTAAARARVRASCKEVEAVTRWVCVCAHVNAGGDHPAVHRVPGLVHVLQDTPRARQARQLRSRGHRQPCPRRH